MSESAGYPMSDETPQRAGVSNQTIRVTDLVAAVRHDLSTLTEVLTPILRPEAAEKDPRESVLAEVRGPQSQLSSNLSDVEESLRQIRREFDALTARVEL